MNISFFLSFIRTFGLSFGLSAFYSAIFFLTSAIILYINPPIFIFRRIIPSILHSLPLRLRCEIWLHFTFPLYILGSGAVVNTVENHSGSFFVFNKNHFFSVVSLAQSSDSLVFFCFRRFSFCFRIVFVFLFAAAVFQLWTWRS